MSLVTLTIFAHDKAAAGKDKWRVPERMLMAWMVCGGAPGGLLGRERPLGSGQPSRRCAGSWR
jgi:uncharacterized membrane protein YsdA (DUF1294 family)